MVIYVNRSCNQQTTFYAVVFALGVWVTCCDIWGSFAAGVSAVNELFVL